MKIKCDECKGIGSYDCDSEPGPYGKQITVECEDCDGEGWIEVEDDEEESVTYVDKICDNVSITFVDELCEQMSYKLVEDAEHVFMTFSANPSRTYHITYFISRGDVTAEDTPLLGGLTLTAKSITHAITHFMSTSGVDESEIKYIVEL
jgi:hypothetical protein